ncbi:peptidase [Vibrio cholerae]|nr:peptidase [Vibrio cholerae]
MWWKVWVIGCALAVSWSINAAVFDLPIEGSSIVGNTQYHKVEKGETLADIAKKYDIGFLALMAANRGVDPFLTPRRLCHLDSRKNHLAESGV